MAKEKQNNKMQTEQKEKNSANSTEKVATRGRIFEGFVIRKFPKRVAIEFERTVFIRKYERFTKKKTRIHARLPDQMQDSIHIGDYIQVQECRPLSKMIHFVVTKRIRSHEELTHTKKAGVAQ